MNNMIKAINLADAEVLTLEKAEDRMEFEALPAMTFLSATSTNTCHCDSGGKCSCNSGNGNCGLNFL